jgi:hypothetical protein
LTEELTVALDASNSVVGTVTPQSVVLAEVTVTTTDAEPLPPGPTQLSVYVYTPTVVRGPTVRPELVTGSVPVQPSEPAPPIATQLVAPVADHLRVTELLG